MRDNANVPRLSENGVLDSKQPSGFFAAYGVTSTLIRDALAAAVSRGADDADVFFQHRVVHQIALEDGIINQAGTFVELGVGIRAIRGDQTGYAFTEELTRASIVDAAKVAAAIADGTKREGPRGFDVRAGLPSRYPVRIPWSDVAVQQKLPLLTMLNARAFAADPRIVKVNVTFGDEESNILIADARGRIVEDYQPMTRLVLSVVAEQNGVRHTNSYSVAGRADIDFYAPEKLERVVREAVARTVILFESVPPPAGEMQIVLAAGASGILLHEAIGHGMEADFNRKGVSIFAEKIGASVAAPFVTIVDDGTQPHARGALNVDDEGNDVGCTTLVHEGVLSSFLHDSISAKHYGATPTGSGRRQSYRYAPMPRMRSTYMLPGPHRKEEIIASVGRGIYCTTFANGQVQIGAGDFTFYVKNGWLIEHGKLTRPVTDVNLIGNGPKVLERIDMVADDLLIDEGGWTCGKNDQSVPVSQGMPTVRVSSMTVGGRSSTL